MSLTSVNHPSTTRISSISLRPCDDVPFHLQPTYLTLHRMLIRYQHIILLQPPSDTLSPFQEEVQRELRSPLPYQRTKWLHNIEYARSLLLQLEHAAQGLKVQATKRDTIRDLAEKRTIIKKLRAKVEELGREENVLTEEQAAADENSETLEEILGRPPLQEYQAEVKHEQEQDGLEQETPLAGGEVESMHRPPQSTKSNRDELFGLRHRKPKISPHNDPDKGTTSGFSSLPTTERILLSDSRTQEDLTTSLVSMAAQLQQQARAFQGALDFDKGLLDRALQGLDANVSGMAAASKNMQFLRKMSEGQGWLGRLKLYAMIAGLWVVAVLLVFVMPKLRF